MPELDIEDEEWEREEKIKDHVDQFRHWQKKIQRNGKKNEGDYVEKLPSDSENDIVNSAKNEIGSDISKNIVTRFLKGDILKNQDATEKRTENTTGLAHQTGMIRRIPSESLKESSESLKQEMQILTNCSKDVSTLLLQSMKEITLRADQRDKTNDLCAIANTLISVMRVGLDKKRVELEYKKFEKEMNND